MDIGISEVSKMLAGRVETVTEMLLPRGKRLNGHWVVGDVSGSPGESLKINLHGRHVGRWQDWASDEKGDLIDLWSKVRGVALPEAYRQARAHLGIPEDVRPAKEKQYAKAKPNETASEAGQIRKYLTDQRKLENSIVNRFRIGAHVRDEEGRKVGFIVFPSYSPEGELVNNCYVGLARGSDGKKRVKQDTGCPPSLFGWHALDAGAYARRSVIICEGQIDAMSWTQWGFDCLSIPNGGGNTWIEYEWENLAVFEQIYLSYDMDAKLSANQESAIQRLGKHRCMIIRLPHKDANDCLRAGMTRADMDKVISEARAPKLANFATLADIRDRVMQHFFPEGEKKLIQPATFKGPFADRTFTVRPGEVTLWTGISHHGKSSLLCQVFIELVMLQQIVFVASFEMKPERTVKKMAICVTNGCIPTREDLNDFIDTVGERIVFFDRVGSAKPEELFEMMRYARARYGATQFMIDSLMKVDGLSGEYGIQSTFMNDMCRFAAENGAHVHLVAHPRKTELDGRPGANDIKGSSDMRNQADNVIIVHRNMEKELKFSSGEMTKEEFEAAWDTSLTVEKDREEGNVKSFRYHYDKDSERFTQMETKPKTFREDPRKRRGGERD